ncbi:hypothetical protein QM797_16000 [Rhodococcus sp. IEGM 1381]|uniref:DUF6779 domain-containing protein n=1 Tax=Rhodococcus sp. IEGM 1381 TaxID=3047085 RepID=UPI0024B6DDF7|nr:DUF6779 domain-containing protein [Rhodococcus sp. IEGM 1381]MDI9896229.1 hypothetical protein [Rhodococcus sp. IEGM 1381]
MTDQTRAKKGRRNRRSASQLFLAALVVFGIVASVFLLFTESVQWMRVGVLSALWAAVIGAFAMTKYRRESAADQIKAKDLQTVYELQLAREISARREYEMSVEARVRSESRMEIDEVAALRNELAALRQNLQVLFDGNLPTERVALRAEAMRMQELGGRRYDSYQPAPSGLYIPGGANGNGVGTPYDEPVTAETSVVYPEGPDEMPQATAASTAPGAQGAYAENAFETEEPSYDESATAVDEFDAVERPAARPRPYSAPRPAARVTPPSSPFTAYNFEQTRPPAAEPEAQDYVPQPTAETSEDETAVAAEYQAAEFQAEEYSTPVEPVQPEYSETQPAADYVSEPVYGSAQEGDPYPASRSALRESADAFFSADRDLETSAVDTSSSPRRGRRRAESTDEDASGAHSNGRSVAEIMAGLAGGDSADTTTTDAGTRRRRRRAD